MNNENIEIIETNTQKKTKKGLIFLIIVLVLIILGLTGYILYDKGIIFNNNVNQTNENNNEMNINTNIDNSSSSNISNNDLDNKYSDYVIVNIDDYNKSIPEVLKSNDLVYDVNKEYKVILDYGKISNIDFKIILTYLTSTNKQMIIFLVNNKEINYYSGSRSEFGDAMKEFTQWGVGSVKPFNNEILFINDMMTYSHSDTCLSAGIIFFDGNGKTKEIDKNLVTDYYTDKGRDNSKCKIEVENNELKYCRFNKNNSKYDESTVSYYFEVDKIKYSNNQEEIIDKFYAAVNEQW